MEQIAFQYVQHDTQIVEFCVHPVICAGCQKETTFDFAGKVRWIYCNVKMYGSKTDDGRMFDFWACSVDCAVNKHRAEKSDSEPTEKPSTVPFQDYDDPLDVF